MNTFHFVSIMLLRSDESFSLSFCDVIFSWKQIIFFLLFPTYCLFLLIKSHSRESFFSKEEMIFRSSHIFEFNFFFFLLLQRILNLLLVGMTGWSVKLLLLELEVEDLLETVLLPFKTSALLFIEHRPNLDLPKERWLTASVKWVLFKWAFFYNTHLF